MGAAPKLQPTPETVLESVFTGDLKRFQYRNVGHSEAHVFVAIPTTLFTQGIDLKMAPPPALDYFTEKDGRPIQISRSTESPSALVLSNFPYVLIREGDFGHLQSYAENQLISPKNPTTIPVERRMNVLRRVALSTVDETFQKPTSENLKKSQKVVGSLVHLMMREPRSFLVLSRLSSHDPYTLQHCVGTAVNAIILSRKSGITDNGILLDAGMAGLLHDIGNTKVDPKILNKPGPLDETEWDAVQEHSAIGFNLLRDLAELGDRVKLAVLEHHEDMRRTGYPNKLDWNEIGAVSKIVGICDIYNALTTDRSYARARTPYEALQLMQGQLKHKFDVELFKNLVLIYGGKIEDLL